MTAEAVLRSAFLPKDAGAARATRARQSTAREERNFIAPSYRTHPERHRWQLLLRRDYLNVVQGHVAGHGGLDLVADLDLLQDVGLIDFIGHGHGFHKAL